MPAEPSPRVEPIGTRLIDSTPPATTTSAWPLITVAAAKATACWEEPHCRSIVVPGTDSGQPAASAASRPTLPACSPTWLTQPQKTSSTTPGSRPARCTSASRTCADRSTGWTPESPPPRLPTGVRTAAQITASRMGPPRPSTPAGDRRSGGVPSADGNLEGVQWSPRAAETVALAAIGLGLALAVLLVDPVGRVMVG